MDSCCYGSSCSSGVRQFLTREEKVQMLQEYKRHLDKESQGVAERISELENEQE